MAVFYPNGEVEFKGTTIHRVYHSLSDDDYLDVVYYEPETRSFKTVTVWTTAAACGSMPKVVEDAPAEIMEAYKQAEERADAERFACEHPKLAANGYTRDDLTMIQLAYPYRSQRYMVEAVVRLLETKTFRSKFRESLRDQVRDWLTKPRYGTPLSDRQISRIAY